MELKRTFWSNHDALSADKSRKGADEMQRKWYNSIGEKEGERRKKAEVGREAESHAPRGVDNFFPLSTSSRLLVHSNLVA